MYAYFELFLRSLPDDNLYAATIRFTPPNSTAEAILLDGKAAEVTLDAEALDLALGAPDEYGPLLASMLFAEQRLVVALAQAQTAAATALVPLRFSLHLDHPRAHGIVWENLCAPDGAALSTQERLLFSRYVPSASITPLHAHRPGVVRALAVAASPLTLEKYKLAPITASDLVQCVSALDDIETTTLSRETSGAPVTLQAIIGALRDGYDILYLMCHGTDRDGQTYLWLESEDGNDKRVSGEQFAEAIASLQRPPLLVVLASCASAGRPHQVKGLTAVGPFLAAAGVGAVVAMQGPVSVATIERMMPVFFRELRRDGQVDRAMAAARAEVHDHPDWWVPVLYMRVRDGKIFAEPAAGPTPASGAAPLEAPEPEPLPRHPAPIGRTAELEACGAILQQNNLLALIGMAGTGKSTLALAIAEESVPQQQIAWHHFTPKQSIDDLFYTLAIFLNHQRRPDLWRKLVRPDAASQVLSFDVRLSFVVQALKGYSCVLWLEEIDNVDDQKHLERVARRLTEEVKTVRIILTARTRPDYLSEEEVYTLPGLSPAGVEQMLSASGVRLDDEFLHELHKQTEGNPALLVLAVKILKHVVDPRALVEELIEAEDTRQFLHKNAESLLTPDATRVMRALSVLLSYGGPGELIDHMLGGSYRRVLRELVQQSLVITSSGTGGQIFRQHALYQAFYYDELYLVDRERYHQKAADYFRTRRKDNLRAATHAVRAGDHTQAAELIGTEIWPLVSAGRSGELLDALEHLDADQLVPEARVGALIARGRAAGAAGVNVLCRASFEQALNVLNAPDGVSVPIALKIDAYLGLGRRLRDEEPRAAEPVLREGLGLARSHSLAEEAANFLGLLASVQNTLGAYQSALESIGECLAMLPDRPSETRIEALLLRGTLQGRLGQRAGELADVNQAYEQCKQLGDQFRMVSILNNLARLKVGDGDWGGAIANFEAALALADSLGLQGLRVALEQNLGILALARGDDERAERLLERSLGAARKRKLARNVIIGLSALGELRLAQGNLDTAQTHLCEALELGEKTGWVARRPEIERRLAELHLARGEHAEAHTHAEQALALAVERKDLPGQGLSRRTRALVQRAIGNHAGALEELAQAVGLLADDRFELARAQALLASQLEVTDPQRAKTLRDEAQAAFTRLGAKRDLGLLVLQR